MTLKIFIFAETQAQAMAYARKNGFRPGNYEVLPRPDGLKAYAPPHRVLLIGRVEKRDDYEDLMSVLKEMNANVDRIAISSA